MDGVFEKFCTTYEVYVTDDVLEEIDNGRAAKTEGKDIFYKAYQQGQVQITHLSEPQKELRDELMGRKTKIGKGEASSIAVVYDEASYIFATNDKRAIDVAKDMLSPGQVVSCDDILEALSDVISPVEILKIRELMNC